MGIKFYDSNGKYWGEYDETRNLFIPSKEPTTKTETQNSNLTFEKRTMRDCYNCKRYVTEGECIECHYEPKDEPQTGEHCNTCRHKDECEGATYEYKNTEWWCLAYAPIEDEPQTERSE